ncbi:biotin--[acetyl-CoA-carboxylase] ligase [Acidithiobacillus sp.]
MAISAPEQGPSADLVALLTRLADGMPRHPRDLPPDAPTLEKALAEAKRWGLPLQREEGGQLRLRYPYPPLRAAAVAQGAGWDTADVSVLPWCDSSNERLRHGHQGPRALLCEGQWAGRGRRGRHWSSPFGRHLYLSLSWPIAAVPEQGSVTLVAALSVHHVLHSLGIPGLGVKWPNDLWVNGRKLAGILVEAIPQMGQPRLIIGLGLNVHADPALPPAAISLHDASVRTDRNTLAGSILGQWETDLRRYGEEGFTAFLSRWQAADCLAGRWVQVSAPDGIRHGRAQGIDVHGRLILEDESGLHAIATGEASLRPAVAP